MILNIYGKRCSELLVLMAGVVSGSVDVLVIRK